MSVLAAAAFVLALTGPCPMPAVTVCGPHLEEHYLACPQGGIKLVRVFVDTDIKLIEGCPTVVRERIAPIEDLSQCPR